MRRLALDEIQAALDDLFPTFEPSEMSELIDDSQAPDRDPALLIPNESFLRDVRPALDGFVARVAEDLVLAACPTRDAACESEALMSIARRAWKGSFTDAAADHLTTTFADFLQADPEQAFTAGLSLVLSSPRFLFLPEPGSFADDVSEEGEFVATGGRLAALLAATLWGSVPDIELLTAAETGTLDTEEGLIGEIDRMLADPRSERGAALFFRSWLAHGSILSTLKDEQTFPSFSEQLKREMFDDTEQMLLHLFAQGAPPNALLTSTWGNPGPTMIEQLGWEGVAEGPGDIGGVGRFGVATHPSILAMNSGASVTSIVMRGKYVVEHLACGVVPSPPDNVDTENVETVDETGRELTAKEQAELHSSEPACAGCHRFLDPFGMVFEGFDTIGAARTEDRGLPIDTSTHVDNALGLDGEFAGPTELLAALAETGQVQKCFATNYGLYGLRRVAPTAAQVCALTATTDSEPPTMREVMSRFLLSRSFLRRVPPAAADNL
jgi:hypothetical protein